VLIVATDVDQQGAFRLRGEGLDQQIVHGHPHLAFPCLSV
jgi:hypothetical protein